MARTGMEIIVRAKDIARNYTGVQSVMLIMITSVCDIYKSFGVTVTIIRGMWRTIVNLKCVHIYIYTL